MDDVSIRLLMRWRSGDPQAADELFRRYVDRLIALARSRLSPQLAHRLDPEDVVQSAYRSFFAGAQQGQYHLERGGDLWRLLAAITLHKLRDQVKHHTRERRDVHAEHNFSGEDTLRSLEPQALASEPSPVEALALVDLLERVMRVLEPEERRMLELRLQGYNVAEIAAEVRLSRRTVKRVLDRVKQLLDKGVPPAAP